jgi:hypothetical protein
VRERAAFFIVDDFSAGLEGWSDYPNLSMASSGLVKVNQGVALYDQTMNLESYRLDLEARIESQAVGWAVRAQDADNLYAMKLEEVARRAGTEFSLLRWSVKGGKWSAPTRVALPAQLARSGEFNRISVRVNDNQFTTLVNGWGVDFWRDEQFERGGVGLLASAGESALVRRMTISGNEDTWGLILYGTLETMRSVQDTLFPSNAPVAFILRPSPLAFASGPISMVGPPGRQ